MINRTEKNIMKNWSSTENPVVSVCCTTYNHENYISDAIDGFLIQDTDFPFEVVVRDDCSTDNTANIIKQYIDKYPNIIKPIYEAENQFSKGVKPMPVVYKKAVGKYFALCEGDDYWIDPLKLQKQVDFLEKNNEYVCCYHNSKIINDKGIVIIDTLITNPKDFQKTELLSNSFMTIHSVMFRNILTFKDEFNEIPFGDMMLWHLLGYYGKAKYLDNIQKAVYRKHEGGMWNGLDKYQQFEKTLLSKNIIKKKLHNNSMKTTLIDLSIRKFILSYLSSALISKDYLLYKKIICKLIEDDGVFKKNILKFIFISIGRESFRKING